MLLNILYVLLGLSMLGVAYTLIMGGRAMSKQGDDRSVSNKWMVRRVYSQAITIGLVLLTLLVKKNGG